jgi:hypothetical protein
MALPVHYGARAGQGERVGNWLWIINDQQSTNMVFAVGRKL